ncbi:hypothetical protein, partial [Shewanella insulae]|uniref:hypothetical protein n=1 Tax=Shewanella insulae TaxID=2681496 RepID=UPI002480B112
MPPGSWQNYHSFTAVGGMNYEGILQCTAPAGQALNNNEGATFKHFPTNIQLNATIGKTRKPAHPVKPKSMKDKTRNKQRR